MSESDKRVPVKVSASPLSRGAQVPPKGDAGKPAPVPARRSLRALDRSPHAVGTNLTTRRRVGDLPESWRSYADLFDLGSEYRVLVEVPGVPREQIDICVSETAVTVSRLATAILRTGKEDLVCSPAICSKILRTVTFRDEVMAERTEATLNNGVLEVRLPKKVPKKVSKHRIIVR